MSGRNHHSGCHCRHHNDHSMRSNNAIVHDGRMAKPIKLLVHPKYEPVAWVQVGRRTTTHYWQHPKVAFHCDSSHHEQALMYGAGVIFCAPALACWRAKSGRLARHLSVSSAHIFQPWLHVLLHPHHHGDQHQPQ
jgi:hypothetical protein